MLSPDLTIWEHILCVAFNGLIHAIGLSSGAYVLSYSAKSALMSASKINISTTPADRVPTLTFEKNGERHFFQMAWINKRPAKSITAQVTP